MKRRDIEKLQNKRSYIIKHLKVSDDLFNILLNDENKILTEELIAEIKSKPELERPSHFAHILSKCGPHAYDGMLNALWMTDQHQLLNELEPRFKNKQQAMQLLNVKPNEMKPEDIIKNINLVGHQSNLHSTTDNTELQNGTQDIIEKNAAKVVEKSVPTLRTNKLLSVGELVDNIKRRIDGEYDVSHDANIDISGKIFVLKSKSEFIDGYDYDYIECLNGIFNCQGKTYCKLVQDEKMMDDHVTEIFQESLGLMYSFVMLVVECKEKRIKFRRSYSCLSKAIMKMVQSIDSSRTSLIIMLTVYGSDCNGCLVNEEVINAARSKNILIIICKMTKFDEDRKDWMICSMLECLRNASCSGDCTLQNICSIISDVGKHSVKENLISGFEILR